MFEIRDYTAVVVGGELAAGDDAADVRWVPSAEVVTLDATGQLAPGLLAALRSWAAMD